MFHHKTRSHKILIIQLLEKIYNFPVSFTHLKLKSTEIIPHTMMFATVFLKASSFSFQKVQQNNL